MKSVLARVVAGEDLSASEMESAMDRILAGAADPAEIAGLAIALRMKGETTVELAAAARVMRARCERVDLARGLPLFDTAGTGGDGVGTFNISTVAAIVIAACGVRVAKHGNRAVSSQCGSADVLEALGVKIDLPPERLGACVDANGIAFLFAPAHHGALKHAASVRKALGVRTFFNLLGPLANPAGATHQIVGVYDPTRVRQMAEVLSLVGVRGAWVVHGEGNLDEISPAGDTTVARLRDGVIDEFAVTPAAFGLGPVSLHDLVGGDPKRNAGIARDVLAGRIGAPRTAVLMNAAAALSIVGRVSELSDGVKLAADAIDSGRASAVLDAWIAFT